MSCHGNTPINNSHCVRISIEKPMFLARSLQGDISFTRKRNNSSMHTLQR